MVQLRINSPVFTASFILRGEINLRKSRHKIKTPVSRKIYTDPTIARIFKTLMFRCHKTVLIHLTSPNTNSGPTRSYTQCPSYESWRFRREFRSFWKCRWVVGWVVSVGTNVLPSLSSVSFFFIHLILENEDIMFLKHVWNHSPKAQRATSKTGISSIFQVLNVLSKL
jgi:hypothetical protein